MDRTTGVEDATAAIVTAGVFAGVFDGVLARVFLGRGSTGFVGASVAHEDISNIKETKMTEQKYRHARPSIGGPHLG